MNIEPLKVKARSTSRKQRRSSLGCGIRFFFLSNIVLVSIILVFIINNTYWLQADSSTAVIMFAFFAEIFIIILSIIACIKPKKEIRKIGKSGERLKERIGALIAFILLSLLSLIFLGLDIPYPSTLILCIIFTNFMVALYSILFHPVALGIYEANVYQERTTVLDYVFLNISPFTFLE